MSIMTKDQINQLLSDNGIATYRSGATCAVFVDYWKTRDWDMIRNFLTERKLVECPCTKAVSYDG